MTCSQIHHADKYLQQHSSIIWPVWLNGWVFVYKLSGCEFDSTAVTYTSDIAPALSKSSLTFRETIECRFTLKLVCDMMITYSQMHCRDKYSQHSSIILSVWLYGWVFIYELSGCGFESHCYHLYFRYSTCFKQGVPWYSGKL